MKSKLILKVIITTLIVLFTVSMFSNLVYAENANFKLSQFDNQKIDASAIITPIETILGAIISVVRIIFTGIAIIMITVIGIKYLSAAPSERADLKKSSIQYVVGAFVLFGSAALFGILQKFITKVLPDAT